MTTEPKSRSPKRPPEPSEQLVADPSASFTYELATKAPTKDVASVKAASDVHDANTTPKTKTRAKPRSHEPAL